MNLDLCSSLTKTLKNIKPYLTIRTRARFSSIFLPFLVNQTQTQTDFWQEHKHIHKPSNRSFLSIKHKPKHQQEYKPINPSSINPNTNPNLTPTTKPLPFSVQKHQQPIIKLISSRPKRFKISIRDKKIKKIKIKPKNTPIIKSQSPKIPKPN